MEETTVSTRKARWSNYVIALLITLIIFATALYASNYFNGLRISDIRSTQDTISTDILSLETQFDLMQEHSCKGVSESTVLPEEMRTMANQLSYMESQGNVANQAEITRLKRLYSLLEIKDYLVMKQIAAKCDLKPIFILYFYSNKGDCKDCENQGYVLTSLAQDYPQLRIYSFDYNLNVSALQTLSSIYDLKGDNLPALVINGNVHEGYQGIDDIQKILPQLKTMQKAASSTSATSTKKNK